VVIPTHHFYTGDNNHRVLTTGQISQHLRQNKVDMRWFELSLDQLVEVFWSSRTADQTSQLQHHAELNVGQKHNIVFYYSTDNYSPLVSTMIARSFNTKCPVEHKRVATVMQLVRVEPQIRFGGANNFKAIGTSKAKTSALATTHTYELGYRVKPQAVSDTEGVTTQLLPEVNIDIAILTYSDKAKLEPMYEKRFVPNRQADCVPLDCTECNEYEVWYAHSHTMADLIIKLTKKSPTGTKAISGQVITVGNQLMFDKYKVFRFTPQNQSITTVLPQLVASGGYVAPVSSISGNSFVITSSRDFPRELAEIAQHSQVQYLRIIDRRTFCVTLKRRVAEGQQSRDTIANALKLNKASESDLLILTNSRNTPWTTVSYDNTTTVIGTNYNCSQQHSVNRTTREATTVYITGFETILTATGVQQYIDYFLNLTCKLVATDQITGDKEVQARFLHPIKLGPGETWLKTLALTSTDAATISKLMEEAAKIEDKSDGRYQHLTYEDSAMEILRLTEHSEVMATMNDRSRDQQETQQEVAETELEDEREEIQHAYEDDYDDGDGYSNDEKDQQREEVSLTSANKFSILFAGGNDDEEEEEENDTLSALPASTTQRKLRPAKQVKARKKQSRTTDDGDFDTTTDTVVASYIAGKQNKGTWPTPTVQATNTVFTNALVRFVSAAWPNYHNSSTTDAKNWHRVTNYFSAALEARKMTMTDVAAKLNKATQEYAKNKSMTTSMTKHFGAAPTRVRKQKKTPATPKRASTRLMTKLRFDIDLSAEPDSEGCSQPSNSDPASYLIDPARADSAATATQPARTTTTIDQQQSRTLSSSSLSSSSLLSSHSAAASPASGGPPSKGVHPMFQQKKRPLEHGKENGNTEVNRTRHKTTTDATATDDDMDMDIDGERTGASEAALSHP